MITKLFIRLLVLFFLINTQPIAQADWEIDINIPSSVLQLIRVDHNQHKKVIKTYAVVLGAKVFKTPVGNYQARELTYNPGWIPPNSAWAQGESVVLPTQDGPLGKASLRFGSDLLIHGSPQFDPKRPYASHGCVRMHNDDVRELVQFLQNNWPNNKGKATPEIYDQNPTQSFKVLFREPILVQINYHRVIYQDGKVVIHEDPYQDDLATDVQLRAILNDQGLLPKVDPKKLMQVVIAADQGYLEFSVKDLFFEWYRKKPGQALVNRSKSKKESDS